MVTTIVRLPDNMKEAIERLSRDSGAPMAFHFRKALEQYLIEKKALSPEGVVLLKDQ